MDTIFTFDKGVYKQYKVFNRRQSQIVVDHRELRIDNTGRINLPDRLVSR